MARTFLLTLQFDGSGFVGWQRQAEGRSVQGEVERVLERLAGHRVVAHGAGRTDAGVHAVGLAVSCTMPPSWEAAALRRALNALLPRDCWVARIEPMRPGFHARRSARERAYRYDVGTDDAAASPFRRRWEWALGRPLDGTRLDAAAQAVLGEHDFSAFAARGEPKPHYRCRLSTARWVVRPDGRGWRFEVAADRFLHHMVRMLVGTMVDAGLGRRPVADVARLLAARSNQDTSPPAPPQGLWFVAARYDLDDYLVPGEDARP
ncbi:MAG TPA: tRNA pseudouridine(38-40) synthase TruA [Gemmatimonadales bacterium]|nr:tRNA pseudouridine(38-40) synthase TruA [Gemmatimonadales bacterium]